MKIYRKGKTGTVFYKMEFWEDSKGDPVQVAVPINGSKAKVVTEFCEYTPVADLR